MREDYVVAIGSVSIDENLVVDSWPKPGDKRIARLKSLEVGGMIANFSCNLALSGIRTYLIHNFADDEYLSLFKNELQKYGVDHSHSPIHEKAKTTRCIVANSGGERTILIILADDFTYDLNSHQLALIKGGKYLYSTISELKRIGNVDTLLSMIHSSETRLVLDVEPETITSYREDSVYFESAGILFFNEFGFEKAKTTGMNLEELQKSRCIVVTKGAAGAELHYDRKFFEVEGQGVEVVDTTGAGDMFNATFLSEAAKNSSFEAALIKANLKAAHHTTQFGPKGTIEGK